MARTKDYGLDTVLASLRAHAAELKRRGIKHSAVFGSAARGEAGADSDVDLLVTLDERTDMDLLDLAGIAADVGEWVGRPADLAIRGRLKAHVREAAWREAVDVF